MESIPGLKEAVNEAEFHRIVAQTGCAIVSASADIAPAGKRLYAIRDVTASVESDDLITGSIRSKKLAASLQGLVLGVKVGSGVFMKSPEDARRPATVLVETANHAVSRKTALITDMKAPLAPALGSALEIAKVMKVLNGAQRGSLYELTLALGVQLLFSGGIFASEDAAREVLSNVIVRGAAAERFGKMVAAIAHPL